MALSCAARKSRGLAAAACFIVVLGGCGTVRDFGGMEAKSGPPTVDPSELARGRPIAPEAAQILESAPAGGRFDYQLANGRPAIFVLGELYQSAWQMPCRIGRVGSTGGSDNPTAYAFCRRGDRWYEMTPVVVSGY